MSVYVDLHQNDLSLSLLRQYLQADEDVIITDIKQLVARITPFVEKSSKLGKMPLTEVEAVCGLYQATHSVSLEEMENAIAEGAIDGGN